MSASSPTSDQRRAELRAAMEDRVQHHRQRPLPTWLASRARRRTLALVPVVLFVLGVLAALTVSTFGLALMVVVAVLGAVGVLVMRRATSMLDAAPATLLDEREITQRDRGYRDAFHLTLALVFALWVLAVANGFAAKLATTALLGSEGWLYLTLTSFFTVATLPAAALTWRWQAPADDHDE